MKQIRLHIPVQRREQDELAVPVGAGIGLPVLVVAAAPRRAVRAARAAHRLRAQGSN